MLGADAGTLGREQPAPVRRGLAMNLKQIETFLWIARLGGFAAAAERLNATQSAISARIQELEQTLGVKLFERGRRAAHLTAKGQELVSMAEALMEQVRRIESSIGQPESVTGILRLGVADLIAMTWLSDFVREMSGRYPMLKLDLRIGLAKELIERLRAGDLDLVLAPGETWLFEFEAVPLGASEFLWMVHRDLPMPDHALTPKDLQNWPIITLSQEAYHHRIVSQWFRDNNASGRNFIECNSIGVIIQLTLSGLGVGLVPRACVEDRLAQGDLRIIHCDPPMVMVKLFAFTRSDHSHPVAQRVAHMAREISPFDPDGIT
jgi:DNA-binding transcriptional LysR family regulator